MNAPSLDVYELAKKLLPGPDNPVWAERNDAFLKEAGPYLRLRALATNCTLLALLVLVGDIAWKLYADEAFLSFDWLTLVLVLSAFAVMCAGSVALGANFKVTRIAEEHGYPFYHLPRAYLVVGQPDEHA